MPEHHLFHHYEQEHTAMEPTETVPAHAATDELTTAPLAADGTPTEAPVPVAPVPVAPAGLDTGDSAVTPAGGPSMASLSAQDMQNMFNQFLQEKMQAEATAAAASASADTNPAHSFATSSPIPEGITEAFQTNKGTVLYVLDSKTFAVKPNGSTTTVDGDVYKSAVIFATLFDL
jgi:hypothetical protein